MPQHSSVFQWGRNAVAVGRRSRRVVSRWTCSGYRRLVDTALGRARKQARPLHFLPYGIAAVVAVRIKLNSHRIWVEIAQKDFDFKCVVVRVGFDPQYKTVALAVAKSPCSATATHTRVE